MAKVPKIPPYKMDPYAGRADRDEMYAVNKKYQTEVAPALKKADSTLAASEQKYHIQKAKLEQRKKFYADMKKNSPEEYGKVDWNKAWD